MENQNISMIDEKEILKKYFLALLALHEANKGLHMLGPENLERAKQLKRNILERI